MAHRDGRGKWRDISLRSAGGLIPPRTLVWRDMIVTGAAIHLGCLALSLLPAAAKFGLPDSARPGAAAALQRLYLALRLAGGSEARRPAEAALQIDGDAVAHDRGARLMCELCLTDVRPGNSRHRICRARAGRHGRRWRAHCRAAHVLSQRREVGQRPALAPPPGGTAAQRSVLSGRRLFLRVRRRRAGPRRLHVSRLGPLQASAS
ncbi:hypothetical protein DFR52_1011290 [Hoeflea marina]|uniref:Uncharacterized protein n=1 Tax=Hoeflea marina TaxID=274592 RepID=A0A317PSY2_9HYPH|nr:hypothetical protein DFR52_1011290 [Hoeflea marina]